MLSLASEHSDSISTLSAKDADLCGGTTDVIVKGNTLLCIEGETCKRQI